MQYLRERVIQKLREELNWIVETEVKHDGPQPSGKITSLRFERFDMEDFEADQTYRESLPLQLVLECNVKGKNNTQSLVLLPAKRALKENLPNEYLWYYPLVLSKLSKGVFKVICSIFEDDYSARMNPLTIPAKFMEHMIYLNAESLYNVELEDNAILNAQGTSPLRLEYGTQLSSIETLQFDIEAEEVLKVCRLAGGSRKFYKAFCRHLLNETKINLPSFQLVSLSCHISSLTLSGRFKVYIAK